MDGVAAGLLVGHTQSLVMSVPYSVSVSVPAGSQAAACAVGTVSWSHHPNPAPPSAVSTKVTVARRRTNGLLALLIPLTLTAGHRNTG